MLPILILESNAIMLLVYALFEYSMYGMYVSIFDEAQTFIEEDEQYGRHANIEYHSILYKYKST